LYRAIVHRGWGVAHRLAGEYPEAADRLSQALTLFQALDTRWQIGRTLSELGELAVAQGATGRARAYFQQALPLFEALRAAPDARRARAALVPLS
ncbi:MAG: tetratricopeptide repeat protein, partial [Anaerolineales bacterium]|nr:tetratricopeptide repeat protein [Anaerolineales bacterium]